MCVHLCVCAREHIPELSIGRWSLSLDYDHQTSFSTSVLIETTFGSESPFLLFHSFTFSLLTFYSFCFSCFYCSFSNFFCLLSLLFFCLSSLSSPLFPSLILFFSFFPLLVSFRHSSFSNPGFSFFIFSLFFSPLHLCLRVLLSVLTDSEKLKAAVGAPHTQTQFLFVLTISQKCLLSYRST